MAGKDVTLHVTSPPYLFKEVEAGAHYVVSGEEAFGESFTFIVGTATDDVLEKQPDAIDIFLTVLRDALAFMEANPEETSELLARVYDMDPRDVAQYLSDASMEYTTEIDGLETFSSFMHKHGYIDVELQEGEVRWSFTDN